MLSFLMNSGPQGQTPDSWHWVLDSKTGISEKGGIGIVERTRSQGQEGTELMEILTAKFFFLLNLQLCQFSSLR